MSQLVIRYDHKETLIFWLKKYNIRNGNPYEPGLKLKMNICTYSFKTVKYLWD